MLTREQIVNTRWPETAHMRKDYEIDSVVKFARAIEALVRAECVPQWQEPVGREGCNYLTFPGRVCNKCGEVHGITAPTAGEQPARIGSPDPESGDYDPRLYFAAPQGDQQ